MCWPLADMTCSPSFETATDKTKNVDNRNTLASSTANFTLSFEGFYSSDSETQRALHNNLSRLSMRQICA